MRCVVPLVLRFLGLLLSSRSSQALDRVFPGETWETKSPGEVGLDQAKLDRIRDYLGGRGCITRHGYMVYTWGDYTRRGDVASAAKPWYAHFVFKAVEDGRLESLDTPAVEFTPALAEINAALDHKDRRITFRHMANQTSCYGVREAPGTAYDYNDWQMALLFDTLFLGVYGSSYERVDADVLHPQLADLMQCEDNPTFLAFGKNDRAGRLGVSPRDFARFGWLYLNKGNWNGRQLISREHAVQAVTSPLPNSIPRTTAEQAEMIPGQRSIGSRRIPDDQADHRGSYSWLWWINGVDRNGKRFLPDAPTDTCCCLGHANGQRGMAFIPSLDIVISWNDTTLGQKPRPPHPLTEVFRLLCEAATDAPMPGQIIPDPEHPAWLVRNQDVDGDGKLDPFFMCGPGDPEDFLYRGERNPDGTRTGDQMAIIDKMIGTGANCIYFQAVRSHGGDGGPTHNPFVDSEPAKGLDQDILNQWETWFRAMDEHGIVIYFFFYDDSAGIWPTGDAVGGEERAFIEGIVKRFAHHKNLIWCVAEEYQEVFSAERVRNIAAVIRAADEHNHVIAVHKLDGLRFDEFADDPNIDQFAVQYNRPDADVLHEGMLVAWEDANGRFSLNMSETANHGTGTVARRKNWACALGGAYVMVLRWTFDTPDAPSVDDLRACGYLVDFFESTNFNEMAPHDELKYAATDYVLALPGDSYIAYASDRSGAIGIRDMTAGTYAFTWLDPVTGATSRREDVAVGAGARAWEPPAGFGEEVAVWVTKVGSR